MSTTQISSRHLYRIGYKIYCSNNYPYSNYAKNFIVEDEPVIAKALKQNVENEHNPNNRLISKEPHLTFSLNHFTHEGFELRAAVE